MFLLTVSFFESLSADLARGRPSLVAVLVGEVWADRALVGEPVGLCPLPPPPAPPAPASPDATASRGASPVPPPAHQGGTRKALRIQKEGSPLDSSHQNEKLHSELRSHHVRMCVCDFLNRIEAHNAPVIDSH